MPSTPIRVVVLDDAELTTAGLRALLAPYGHRVVLVDLHQALARPAELDVLLFEPSGQSGVADSLLRDLQAAGRARPAVFSWAPRDQLPVAAATPCIPKSLAGAQLVVALEEVAAGRYVERGVKPSPPPAEPSRPAAAPLDGGAGAEDLSPRERQIVSLIVAGRSNREIGEALTLSVNSVKTYVRSAYRKMEVSRRTQAVLWGLAHELTDELDPDSPAPDPTALVG